MYSPCGGGNVGFGNQCGLGWRTVTVNVQVALWPQLSLAVHVTVVVPMGKVLPLGGLHTTVTGAQPPPVVGAGYVTLAPAALDAAAFWFGGQVIDNCGTLFEGAC